MGNRLMGPVDTIWLNMDRPDNLMIIDGLMFFDGPVDLSRLRSVVERRLLGRFPVFTQRPLQSLAGIGPPYWSDDPDFDLDRHITEVTLERDDDAELQRYVESRIPVPFDRRHPLWEMHLIHGHQGGSVAYSRIHHALADGIALNQVLQSLTDETPDGDQTEAADEAAAADLAELAGVGAPMGDVPGEMPGARPGIIGEAAIIAGSTASAALGAASGAAYGATRALLSIPRLLDPHLPGDAFTQAQRTGSIANKLLLGPKPSTPLSGRLSPGKRAVWSETFPLANIKHIGHRTGTTVNDVLMGAVAGALAAYMRDHGSEPEDVSTMVPVNVRPLDRPLPRELGNQFALVLFKYPSSFPTPLERIVETHRRMEIIKHSPEVLLTFGLIKAIGRTGPALERYFVDFFAGKAIGVTTNVPGPTGDRYLAGTKISGVLSWVPGSGEQTVGVSIFTYNGSVRVGFKTDTACVPDPEKLVHAFAEEIDGLLRLSEAI